MNPVFENLFTRRSVRAFTDREIAREDLELIAKAGIYAPSGQNRQTWKLTVVTDREKIKKLADLVGEKLGREGYDMYAPAALIIPSNEKENRHSTEDNACALENMFLAAHALGIGSVWINQVREVCGDSQVRELLTKWGIPENHLITGCAALGYAKEEAKGEIEKKGRIEFVD